MVHWPSEIGDCVSAGILSAPCEYSRKRGGLLDERSTEDSVLGDPSRAPDPVKKQNLAQAK